MVIYMSEFKVTLNYLCLVCLVCQEVALKSISPFVHSVDLMLIVLLSRALRDVSFSPFSEPRSDLTSSKNWIGSVVSEDVVFIAFSSTSFSGWSTMWKLVFIIVSTSLVVSAKVSLHTSSIFFEFSLPCFFRSQKSVMIIKKLSRVGNKFIETLERVSWWNLLFVSGGNGENNGG